MSASLVGSEMCIRDSGSVCVCVPACLHACLRACVPACTPACLPARLPACLLYTSDAADDM
eukprot:3870495-Alexandrium_andersonii.AAC.1